MRLRFSLLLTAVVAVAVVGCATPGAGSAGAPSSVVGTWGDEAAAYLALHEDGSLQGSDGCNGLGGSYTTGDDVVTVSLGFSTLMACPGVDTWLRSIATATVDGDRLVVRDRDGNEIGTLARAE